MAFLDCGLGDEFVRGRGFEIGFDFRFQRRLIALQRQQEIGFVLDDLGGYFDLASHGVDGDESAFELPRRGQLIEQHGDRRDLVGLLGHADLRQDEAGVGRIGAQRVQGFEALSPVVGATRGLAVDGDQIVPGRPHRLDPIFETTPKVSGSTRFTRVRSQRSQGMP